MTETLPAVPTSTPAVERPVHRADTDSWIEVVGEVAKFAGYIAGTEFVPKSLRDSPAAATAAIMYGRELGLSPMTALTQTHVIEGRPSISAAGKRALVISQGHEIQTLESTGAICRMRARRRGTEEWTPEVVWSIDMARAAGLLSKNNWKSHPRRMLQARASGELCDLHFPDVTLGFTTVEDLEDEGAEEQHALEASAPRPTSKVTRKTTTAKRTPAALPPAAERPAPTEGPPLPGETGYDQAPTAPTEQTSAGEPGDGPSASHAEGSGEDSEGTPADVVDGTVVEAPDTETTSDPEPAPTDPPAEERKTGPRAASRAQLRMIFAQLGELGVDSDDREERLVILGAIARRALASANDLTHSDAQHVIDTLSSVKDRAELNAILDAFEQQ